MTHKENVATLSDCDTSALQPCMHEGKGHRNILIHTVDTDLVVTAISEAINLGGIKMWISFGL